MWLSFGLAVFFAGVAGAGEKRTGRGGDVSLPHQAFAYEEGRNADSLQAGQIGRGEDATLADDDAVLGNPRRKALADSQGGFKSAQVSVVDPDHARLQLESTIKLIFRMNFNKHVHAI